MPDGCKQILSPFTGRKKQKAWIKTRKKYMPLKNLPETDRWSYYKAEWLEEFLHSKGPFYSGNKIIIMIRVIMKIVNSSSYWMVLPIVATK